MAYRFFLKRALQELNPDAVIPERVSSALDTLAEGLLIIDENGMIVFSNKSFAEKTGLGTQNLMGKSSSDLEWTISSGVYSRVNLPWLSVLEGHSLPEDVQIKLTTAKQETLTFAINASPVMGSEDKVRGVLVTFDDISEMERKNAELERTNAKLKQREQEINRQNEELQFLATRDPLTNTLNRRSFFQGLDLLFADSKVMNRNICCIMVDIDHFKQVNDNYGHAVGDTVIKCLGKVLLENARANDLVGRYGGEEFCIILPGTELPKAAQIAERIRLQVAALAEFEPEDKLRITSSFGISDLSQKPKNPSELVDFADQGLYYAKENGRDQVAVSSCLESPRQDILHALSEPFAEDIETGGLEANDAPGQPKESKALSTNPPGSAETSGATPPPMSDSPEYGQSLLDSRALISDRIDQALKHGERQGTLVAVLAMNVGSLQKVNDTLGYRVGERFIEAVVHRLQKTLRTTDTVLRSNSKEEMLFSVARSGNDELVLVLTDLDSKSTISGILQRIQHIFTDPVEAGSMEFFLDLHLGISVSPDDGQSSSELLQNASSAMHKLIADEDHNYFKFFDQQVNEQLVKQMQLESELHRAIEREELAIYYQPKVNLKSGAITGFEALLRWHHPKLGTIMPDEFIPLAEQAGMIGAIGQWVLRNACLQTKCWHEMGYTGLSIAVNVSPVEFRDKQLASNTVNIIQSSGIAAELVELEITETAMIQDINVAKRIVEEMVAGGVIISLDDFGVGYSSLSYLQSFPLHRVKIDRSFIQNFLENSQDAEIVSAIVAMSHSLGLGIIAEGVETEEHLRFLQDLSCDQAQGYLISKPMPHDKVPEFLDGEAKIRHMVVDGRQDSNVLTLRQTNNMIGVLNDFSPAVGQ
ncbi:MAG: EAL domain-containing protein [Pseudomonadales bacterium]|nr:MAG: EAL domain-containing protein [Pseudomonadales bacterium]